jgi:hypothetical protein
MDLLLAAILGGAIAAALIPWRAKPPMGAAQPLRVAGLVIATPTSPPPDIERLFAQPPARSCRG